MKPHDKGWCKEYIERLSITYDDESAEFMVSPDWIGTPPVKGGPWRYAYTAKDGTIETGVLQQDKKADAQAYLRRKLNRKRLPIGITWEIDR